MHRHSAPPLFVAALCAALPALAVAQPSPRPSAQQGDQGQQWQGDVIEEVVTLGTRTSRARSEQDSPVPVDLLSAGDLRALGNTADITDSLKALVPSYTATTATGDGSAFVRPTSLRGMAPDQTLALVNGKRRHRSALVHFFAPAAGNGAHGADIAMIPAIALKNVQVLRDGAAAQYGSDAIAGVINFALRDDSQGSQVRVQYGNFYEGEQSFSVAFNTGMVLAGDGFLNLSLESFGNDALSRGIQRGDAQKLIDMGVSGVGQDSPFDDRPFVQTWGRPETSGLRTAWNAAIPLASGGEWYLHGNYADTDGRFRYFYRPPDHPFITGHDEAATVDPAQNPQSEFRTGFTPYMDGYQTDTSLTSGLRGELGQTSYDISASWGQNDLDYFLFNTLNPDLLSVNGVHQRDFDIGGYTQTEINLNADFSRQMGDNTWLSWGLEWRDETYTVKPGEPNAVMGRATSGFSAPRDEHAGDFSRSNYAIYLDVEQELSDALLMQYALRYEDFSDFGNTVNGKIAGRLRISGNTALRGAISTGFHAPTPGQANVQTTTTTFTGTTQVDERLVQPTSTLAISLGGRELKEEESTSISLGMTTMIGPLDLTADIYSTSVDDRIYRTGDIPHPNDPADCKETKTCNNVSFYTNALSLQHQGLDLVLSGEITPFGLPTEMTFAFNHNAVEITDQAPVGTINPVSDKIIEDIENNYPQNRFTLSTYSILSDRIYLMLRANFYGEHYDERGTIAGATCDPDKVEADDPPCLERASGNISAGSRAAQIGSTLYIDAELHYDWNDNLRLTFGASNLLDTYVDEIPDGGELANRIGVGLPYPRRTPANYEGGSWYLTATWNF